MIGLLYSAVRSADIHNFKRFQDEELEVIERLSSGKAINDASYDLSSMGHLSKMKVELLGSNQALRNSNDAFSFAEVVEAALADCEESLHRMKELAMQAMDGANNNKDIKAIEKEFNELKETLAKVIDNTEFAGTKIFNDKTKCFQTNWKPAEIVTFKPVELSLDQFGQNKMVTDGDITAPKLGFAYSFLSNGTTSLDSFTLQGAFGDATISVTDNQSSYSIANQVNQYTQTTGVQAEAVTYAKL